MWRLRLPIALGIVAASGACVCVVPSSTGDLTVYYTFGGARCDAAGVDRIRIVAVGDNHGDGATKNVGCDVFGDGLTIQDLTADTYAVTVQGRDSGGNVLYATASPLTMRVHAGSDNQYDVDAPAATGDLSVYWSFEGDTDCTTAGVSSVTYTLYDPTGAAADSSTFDCTAGGISWTGLDPGSWSIDLDGLDAGGNAAYSASASVPVVAGQENSYQVDLTAQ